MRLYICVEDEGQLKLITDSLSGPYCLEVDKDPDFTRFPESDLLLLDEKALLRYSSFISSNRRSDRPGDSRPIVLAVISDDSDPLLLENADEVIFLPIKRHELAIRVKSMLLNRDLKEALKNSADEYSELLAFGQDRMTGMNLTDLQVPEARDVTEEKETQWALEESAKWLRSIFHASPDLISINRYSDGRIIDVNPALFRLTGMRAEDVVGKTYQEVDIWADCRERDSLLAMVRDHKDVDNFEAAIRHVDGSVRRCLVSTRMVELKKIRYIIAIIRDIERIKSLQEERDLLFKRSEAHRKQLEFLLEASPAIIYSCLDVEGCPTTFISDNVSRELGWRPEDFTGNPDFWTDHLHPEDRGRILHDLRSGFHGTQIYRFLHADGSYRWIRDEFRKIRNRGAMGEIVGYLIDISDQVKAERERDLLVTAVEHSAEAVFISDSRNSIVYANRVFEDMYGYSREEVIGKTPGILRSGHHDVWFFKELKRRITGGLPWRGELINRKKDGGLVEVDVSITPIMDDQGRVSHYVSVHRDITEQRLLERRMQRSQRLEAIGTLAGGIAHDFNNILTPILGYADICMMLTPKGSRLQSHIKNIMDSANRAKSLVRQILSFSRKSESERMPISVTPIVKEVLKLLRASIPSNIEIRQRIENVRLPVLGDPTEIHQIIMNLCTNAFQAMPDGGVLSIGISLVEPDEYLLLIHGLKPGPHVMISVEDTGTGISPQIQERIFEPYFTTKGESEGTGLGLAITHGLVRSCGGSIAVKSEPGRGSLFTVMLPAIPDEAEAVKPVSVDTKGGDERILFVDDEPVIVELAQSFLEKLGYSVAAFISPEAAAEAFEKEPDRFDLLVSDMTMPKITGDRLVHRIRRIRPDIPVIICTGFSTRVDRFIKEGLDVDAVVSKPFNISSLANTIRKILDRNPSLTKDS